MPNLGVQAWSINLPKTLAELGKGFAFVGRQVHLDIDGDEFYVALLLFRAELLSSMTTYRTTSRPSGDQRARSVVCPGITAVVPVPVGSRVA